ncbi:MAG: lysophospholipid acyltransferase family protein [Deltaproteobacteria bacterium]|nr:lysophospholipid acyltransferase family protein [Deltaproteobacteria bacterium]
MASVSFKKKTAVFLIPYVFKLLIVTIESTCRHKWIDKHHLDNLKSENQNWIYATWHNNTAIASWILRNQKMVAMVSSSTDGEFFSRIMNLMGNSTVRGSSTRGGAKALLSLIKILRNGQLGIITPDGPRGPIFKLQSGSISLAQKSGVPLVPLHLEASRQWIFTKSWDKHKLPKPFSTIVIKVGEPYWVPSKLNEQEFEEVRIEFEKKMVENQNECQLLIDQIRNNNEV